MPEELQRAAAHNHREWFCATALASDGEVRETAAVTWTWTPAGCDSMIAFPTLAADHANAQLDEIIAFYLARPTPNLVGCWSLTPTAPADLGVRLLARGFQMGWQPCWMALDVQQMRADHSQPASLSIEADNKTSLAGVASLPYAEPNDDVLYQRLDKQQPGRAQRYVARLNGRIVGHSTVWLSRDAAFAGIYSVGVVPEARNTGVGKAVVIAACQYAARQGAHHVLLNATGRRMYEQVGFRWVGDGQTWWLDVPRLAAHPPTQIQVALAEAIGRGDLAALDALADQLTPNDLGQPLSNGLSWLELAVTCRQPSSAEWLMQHGVPLDPLTAWDFGWQDRAAHLLTQSPALVNQGYGEGNLTLLHIAAERGDVALAQLALAAHPDLTRTDAFAKSTPLGWAKYFGRPDIVALIEAAST